MLDYVNAFIDRATRPGITFILVLAFVYLTVFYPTDYKEAFIAVVTFVIRDYWTSREKEKDAQRDTQRSVAAGVSGS
jgi:hypothetical protein